ncbi:MAG: hypothetical protein U1C33_01660, partial [Candidatus Cloacimonadaceae bacterium]|nr:hypothetical protein [Candidatus Cloacimonadaceae bacterium]
VAMPLEDGNTSTAEVGAIMGDGDSSVDAINLWDSASQQWIASTNYGGGFWDPELLVENGSALYFNAIEPFAFYSIGSLPAAHPVYSVVAGLNTAMVPLNLNAAWTSEVGITMGDGDSSVDAINLWDAGSQQWIASTNYGGGFWDPELEVSIGSPLYFNAIETFTWPNGRSTSIRASRSSNK